MNGRVDYAALVVTFRRADQLPAALASLAEQTCPPRLVVVADNDPARSAEGVVARFADSFPGAVEYLPVGENLGPAGGLARASRLAADHADRGEWMLVMDDDDPLGHREIVESLMSRIESASTRLGAVGMRGATLDRWMRLHRCVGAERAAIAADYVANGGCPLYRWEAIEEVGSFDPDMFFGFEELELGLRLRASGWALEVVSLPSLHSVSESSSDRTTWREYFKTRGLVWVARNRVGVVGLAVTLLRSVVAGSVLVSVRGRDAALGLARIRGAWDALRGRMGPAGRAPTANPAKPVLTKAPR